MPGEPEPKALPSLEERIAALEVWRGAFESALLTAVGHLGKGWPDWRAAVRTLERFARKST